MKALEGATSFSQDEITGWYSDFVQVRGPNSHTFSPSSGRVWFRCWATPFQSELTKGSKTHFPVAQAQQVKHSTEGGATEEDAGAEPVRNTGHTQEWALWILGSAVCPLKAPGDQE